MHGTPGHSQRSNESHLPLALLWFDLFFTVLICKHTIPFVPHHSWQQLCAKTSFFSLTSHGGWKTKSLFQIYATFWHFISIHAEYNAIAQWLSCYFIEHVHPHRPIVRMLPGIQIVRLQFMHVFLCVSTAMSDHIFFALCNSSTAEFFARYKITVAAHRHQAKFISKIRKILTIRFHTSWVQCFSCYLMDQIVRLQFVFVVLCTSTAMSFIWCAVCFIFVSLCFCCLFIQVRVAFQDIVRILIHVRAWYFVLVVSWRHTQVSIWVLWIRIPSFVFCLCMFGARKVHCQMLHVYR